MWPSFRGNSFNCPTELFATAINDNISKVYIGGLIWATSVIDDNNNVYVGSTNRTFVCLNKQGDVVWKYKIQPINDSLIDSAAAIHPNGFIVVPGGDGQLYALDKTTGNPLWIKDNNDDNSKEMHKSGVIVNSFEGNVQIDKDGNIYAGCDNDFMYCLYPDGKTKWKFKTNMMIWTCAVITDKYCYFGSLDCCIYVCDKETGTLVTKYDTLSEIKSSPIFYNDNLYVCNTNGKVMSFSKTLKLNWERDIGRNIYATPIIWRETIICCTMNGDVFSLSISSGKIIWKTSLYKNICSSPLVVNNTLIIANNLCKLIALDVLNGKIIGSISLNKTTPKRSINASLALDKQGRIVVGSYDGFIYFVPCNFYERYRTNNIQDIAELRHNQRIYLDVQRDNQHIIVIKFVYQGLQNAAIAFGSVKITPKIPYIHKISADGSFINLIPTDFSYLDKEYNVTISAQYYLQSNNWFVDRFKLCQGTIIQKINFSSPKTQSLDFTANKIDMGNLYILQPTVLDTYIPAAMDAQGFRLLIKGNKVKFLPALPDFDNGFVVDEDDKRSFIVDCKVYKNVMALTGKFSFSAMGGTITCNQCVQLIEFLPDKTVRGQFWGSANCFSIKGNGKTYKFSSEIVNQLFDTYLQLNCICEFSGKCNI